MSRVNQLYVKPAHIVVPFAFRPLSSSYLTGSNDTFESDDSLITLLVVGSEGLAQEFAQGVEVRWLHLESSCEKWRPTKTMTSRQLYKV